MDFEQFWASQPRFDPFPPDGTPVPIHWCVKSKALADWCLRLVDTLCEDPVPSKVDYAKARLLDNFCRSVIKATQEHQAETPDKHPCFLGVLLTAWEELEEVILRRGIPELHPPAPGPVVPIEAIPPADADKAYTEQETGIILGIGESEGEGEES